MSVFRSTMSLSRHPEATFQPLASQNSPICTLSTFTILLLAKSLGNISNIANHNKQKTPPISAQATPHQPLYASSSLRTNNHSGTMSSYASPTPKPVSSYGSHGYQSGYSSSASSTASSSSGSPMGATRAQNGNSHKPVVVIHNGGGQTYDTTTSSSADKSGTWP
jgi:hypothetical protein